MLLSRDHSVEILVVVFVKRRRGSVVPDPHVDCLGEASECFSGEVDMGVAVRRQRRVLGRKAVVLLLRVGY